MQRCPRGKHRAMHYCARGESRAMCLAGEPGPYAPTQIAPRPADYTLFPFPFLLSFKFISSRPLGSRNLSLARENASAPPCTSETERNGTPPREEQVRAEKYARRGGRAAAPTRDTNTHAGGGIKRKASSRTQGNATCKSCTRIRGRTIKLHARCEERVKLATKRSEFSRKHPDPR